MTQGISSEFYYESAKRSTPKKTNKAKNKMTKCPLTNALNIRKVSLGRNIRRITFVNKVKKISERNVFRISFIKTFHFHYKLKTHVACKAKP